MMMTTTTTIMMTTTVYPQSSYSPIIRNVEHNRTLKLVSGFCLQTSSGRTKLHTLVDFPVNGLDLTPYLEVRQKSPSKTPSTHGWGTWGRGRASSTSTLDENVYDLYAVCNHLGGMSGGHYTAYCRSPVSGQWFLFDDTRVEKTASTHITTKGAYLLFYARRGGDAASSASESSVGSDHWAWRMPSFSYESIVSSEDLDEPHENSQGELGELCHLACIAGVLFFSEGWERVTKKWRGGGGRESGFCFWAGLPSNPTPRPTILYTRFFYAKWHKKSHVWRGLYWHVNMTIRSSCSESSPAGEQRFSSRHSREQCGQQLEDARHDRVLCLANQPPGASAMTPLAALLSTDHF